MKIVVTGLVLAISLFFAAFLTAKVVANEVRAMEKQLTDRPHGHVLTNTGVWSPDSQWIVYDVRSDAAGENFDGRRIERVHVSTSEVEIVFESGHGAACGVVTYSPVRDCVVFIHGPERPTVDWQYAATHRRGVLVNPSQPGIGMNLDARDLMPPFTPGALRGGTHVHTFSGDGQWVAFTYEDHVLQNASATDGPVDLNQRSVGVSAPVHSVIVPRTHPRNHDGSYFSALVTRTTNQPERGSDQISRAFSDAWVGRAGYQKANGTQQSRAIAFQGHVLTAEGNVISEAFIVDLPDDLTAASEFGPLAGTATTRPQPPLGAVQRRLTYTAQQKHPGIQGVRHWLRSSPDGERIAFLMKPSSGIAQLFTISPSGGQPQQLTQNDFEISSAFSWNPDGTLIAHTMDQSVCVTNAQTGKTMRLTEPNLDAPLRPEACVFSPDGKYVAYVRQLRTPTGSWNQIFILDVRQAIDAAT